MNFVYNDGGRKAAGYDGRNAGDCVVRAIAIASGLPYAKVYADLKQRNEEYADKGWGRVATKLRKNSSPRNGNFKKIYHRYLTRYLGYTWKPFMTLGSGCQVHMREEELPKGHIIVRLSKHLAAVLDGVLHDTHDCTRQGTRCVYGYYYKEA